MMEIPKNELFVNSCELQARVLKSSRFSLKEFNKPLTPENSVNYHFRRQSFLDYQLKQ